MNLNGALFSLNILGSENSFCWTVDGADLQNVFSVSLNQFHLIEVLHNAAAKPSYTFQHNKNPYMFLFLHKKPPKPN